MRTRCIAILLVAAAALHAASPGDTAYQAGLRLFRADKTEAALAQFTAAVAADGELLSARFFRAKCLERLSRWADAATEFEAVLARKPESAPSWTELARCRMELKETDAAVAALNKALALEKGSVTAAELKQQLDRQPKPAAPATVKPRPAPKVPQPVLPGAPALGSRVGVSVEGVRLVDKDKEDLGVDGQRLVDYTFGSAPSDWVPGGGTWAITNRYACEPDWSFFGGHSKGLCAIWNKRRFAGDMVIEAYVAFKHGLGWANKDWFYIPSDLNINVCSDFNNLASGYSFIYSGRSASTTMIRRGTTVLAQSSAPEDLLPQFLDQNPLFVPDSDGKEFGTFHRHWWRLECRKIGQQISFWVDGRKVLEATDPQPVESGHLAFWTVGSGMMIARVRVAYGNELRMQAPVVVAKAAAIEE